MVVEAFRSLDSSQIPQTYEEVSRERMRNSLEARVLELNPEIDSTVPQPLSQIIDVIVSYHYNNRHHQNLKRLGTFTRFAAGGDLNQRLYEAGLTEIAGESEDSKRARILARPYTSTATTAGLQSAVLSNPAFSGRVRGTYFVYSPATGISTVSVLARGDGQDPAQLMGVALQSLIDEVIAYLGRDDVGAQGSQFTANTLRTGVVRLWGANIVGEAFGGRQFSDVHEEATDALKTWIDTSLNFGNRIRAQDIYRILDTIPGSSWQITSMGDLNSALAGRFTGTGVNDLAARPAQAWLGVLGTSILITEGRT